MASKYITIEIAKNGFIVGYPDGATVDGQMNEIASSVGKALRIAREHLEKHSLVSKAKEDDTEA